MNNLTDKILIRRAKYAKGKLQRQTDRTPQTNPDFTDKSGELLSAAVKYHTAQLDHNLTNCHFPTKK